MMIRLSSLTGNVVVEGNFHTAEELLQATIAKRDNETLYAVVLVPARSGIGKVVVHLTENCGFLMPAQDAQKYIKALWLWATVAYSQAVQHINKLAS